MSWDLREMTAGHKDTWGKRLPNRKLGYILKAQQTSLLMSQTCDVKKPEELKIILGFGALATIKMQLPLAEMSKTPGLRTESQFQTLGLR